MNMKNDNTSVYRKLLEIVEAGLSGVLVTVIEKSGSGPSTPGSKMLIWGGTRIAGTVGGGAVEFEAIEESNRVQNKAESYQKSYSFDDEGNLNADEKLGMVCGGKARLFFEYIPPRENLYLFGAGHVGSALTEHAKSLGFRIIVIDSREGYARRLDNIQKAIEGDFATLRQEEDIFENAYFVIASHSHSEDFNNLKQIIAADVNPKYIGCIASKGKARKFAEELINHFGKGLDLSRLYSPIGLRTGGKTVEDIAVSIIAEIQSIRYGKTGNDHLSIIQKEFTNDRPD
ncbi:MAG: XdhC family protein [Candidatus Zixiibacteriota bacterium]